MATKFFQICDRATANHAKTDGKVGFQNVSLHSQQVTEQGNRIGPQEHGIVDKVDSVLQSLIDNGVCVVNEVEVVPFFKKAKAKASEFVPEEEPATEEFAAEISVEEPDAAASDGDGSDTL